MIGLDLVALRIRTTNQIYRLINYHVLLTLQINNHNLRNWLGGQYLKYFLYLVFSNLGLRYVI